MCTRVACALQCNRAAGNGGKGANTAQVVRLPPAPRSLLVARRCCCCRCRCCRRILRPLLRLLPHALQQQNKAARGSKTRQPLTELPLGRACRRCVAGHPQQQARQTLPACLPASASPPAAPHFAVSRAQRRAHKLCRRLQPKPVCSAGGEGRGSDRRR